MSQLLPLCSLKKRPQITDALHRPDGRQPLIGLRLSLLEPERPYGIIVQNNPINMGDPIGLINFLFGGGGSLMAPTGAEGSGGVVLNPGWGGYKGDIGIFGSTGTGGGVNVSSDIFAGYIKGSMSDVSGVTTNINIVAGLVSLTFFINPDTGELMGLTAGLGPSASPVGASGTISATGILTLGDLLKFLKGRFLGDQKLHPCH